MRKQKGLADVIIVVSLTNQLFTDKNLTESKLRKTVKRTCIHGYMAIAIKALASFARLAVIIFLFRLAYKTHESHYRKHHAHSHIYTLLNSGPYFLTVKSDWS